MDFNNLLEDAEVSGKSEAKCRETIRKAVCPECARPKDLIIMMHPLDLKILPFQCEVCHGEQAIDWDAHIFDIVAKLLELSPTNWSEKANVRPAVLARGGLVSQAGVLALLRSRAPTPDDTILRHMISSNVSLFGLIRAAAPNDASVVRIHEILSFCSEALHRHEGERLMTLAQHITFKTREAHIVVWELATQECYSTGHYEDALRCLLYGIELREGILPPFEASNSIVLSIEELLVLSLTVPTRTNTGFNLARVAQRLGKPAVAALHVYRCVANSSRLTWQAPQHSGFVLMTGDRKTHRTHDSIIASSD